MTPEQAVSVQLEEDAATLIFRLLERTSHQFKEIMSAIDDLKTQADATVAAIAAADAKVETLIALCNSNFAALEAFINSGGLSPDQVAQLQAIGSSLLSATNDLAAEGAKVDSAVAADTPAA